MNESFFVNGNCFNLKEPTFEPMALDNYSFIGTLRLKLLAPIILNVGDNYSIFWLYDGPNTDRSGKSSEVYPSTYKLAKGNIMLELALFLGEMLMSK